MITCPLCKVGEVVIVEADEPWHPEHLQCDDCDSTFNTIELVKAMYISRCLEDTDEC